MGYSSYGRVNNSIIKMKIHNIQTKDKVLFTKLRSLRFTDEIIIDKSKKNSINKIVKNINRKEKKVNSIDIGSHIIIRRLRPLNLNIKLTKR